MSHYRLPVTPVMHRMTSVMLRRSPVILHLTSVSLHGTSVMLHLQPQLEGGQVWPLDIFAAKLN